MCTYLIFFSDTTDLSTHEASQPKTDRNTNRQRKTRHRTTKTAPEGLNCQRRQHNVRSRRLATFKKPSQKCPKFRNCYEFQKAGGIAKKCNVATERLSIKRKSSMCTL